MAGWYKFYFRNRTTFTSSDVGGGRLMRALSLPLFPRTGRRALLDKETVKLRSEKEHFSQ